ncbi:MrcB family domain-containing protein [Actinosynnema pretiosum]|uniref:MrcB family domain-containing protein n=1 Tax=Actinosynnema pretiosum TaxID=42197 RepID=UPI0012FDC2FD|nr:DUF3578 domain-containing protein [Actinosynnema pretiosum]
MRDLLQGVLQLQPVWSQENTVEMQERGKLVRDGITRWLRARVERLDAELPEPIGDLRVEARDGTGRKSEIPWARVYSHSRSPSATKGWYLVYLFNAQGDGAYLNLGKGATRWENDELHPLPHDELRRSTAAARERLRDLLDLRPDLVTEISLDARRSQLGPAYEAGTVAGFHYPIGEVPDEDVLERDLGFLLGVLAELHHRDGRAPEVVEAERAAEVVAGRRRAGQGFLRSAAERKAVEGRAVLLAAEHLEGLGYEVEDVGAVRSYDLDARRGDERLFVEVKGTTQDWGADSRIVLTRNEVELNRREHRDSVLVVVSGISLDRATCTASGGEVRVARPWRIDEERLTPVSYQYVVGGDVVPVD